MSLSESHKKAISEAQIRRWEKIREQAVGTPDKRRCVTCDQWKSIDQFHMRKRINANGSLTHYPSSVCAECDRRRAAEWRAQKRATGELSERQRVWNSNRDAEHRNAYQREYQTIQRRKQGAQSRGPWKKYRERPKQLDARPFLEYIAHLKRQKEDVFVRTDGQFDRFSFADWLGITMLELERIERYSSPDLIDSRTLSIDLIDKVLTEIDRQDMLDSLYPLPK